MSVELDVWASVRTVTKILAMQGIIQDEEAEWKLFFDGMAIQNYIKQGVA